MEILFIVLAVIVPGVLMFFVADAISNVTAGWMTVLGVSGALAVIGIYDMQANGSDTAALGSSLIGLFGFLPAAVSALIGGALGIRKA
ncbi:MAG: hypothetical protein H9533_06145 [Rhodobacteraceae bacterium]|nr:hypothetical protein [Paracoccaceae bacterium]